jgi:hypothetical protein
MVWMVMTAKSFEVIPCLVFRAVYNPFVWNYTSNTLIRPLCRVLDQSHGSLPMDGAV